MLSFEINLLIQYSRLDSFAILVIYWCR